MTEATYPAAWLHYVWSKGKFELTDAATILLSAGGFIAWWGVWLVPAVPA